MIRSVMMVALAGALVLLTGCRSTADLSADELEQRAVDLMRQLPVDPLGEDDYSVTVSEVKLDPPYVSAHGIGADIDTAEMVDALIAKHDADALEVRHRRSVDDSLGYEVLASDGRLVVRAQIGPGVAGSEIYPSLDGGSYIAIQLANVGGGPGWTDVER